MIMQYKGQSAEGALPMNDIESEHPELMFTEADRETYQGIIDGVVIPDVDTTQRWFQQVEVMGSHQAAYFLEQYMKKFED